MDAEERDRLRVQQHLLQVCELVMVSPEESLEDETDARCLWAQWKERRWERRRVARWMELRICPVGGVLRRVKGDELLCLWLPWVDAS